MYACSRQFITQSDLKPIRFGLVLFNTGTRVEHGDLEMVEMMLNPTTCTE